MDYKKRNVTVVGTGFKSPSFAKARAQSKQDELRGISPTINIQKEKKESFLKKFVKKRIKEVKESFKENKEFKKRIRGKIKVAKRKAFEKQITVEAKKLGAVAAKRYVNPPKPVYPAVGMFHSNFVGQPSKPKKGKQKPQRPFDPFRDLIQ